MTTLTLTRFAYAPFGTYGTLNIGNTKLYTCELPWKLNAKRISCIPEGTYTIRNHSSTKYPNSRALVGHAHNVHYQPGPGVPESARTAILIHAGNVPSDLMGCIAPGMAIGWLKETLAVTSSKVALQKLTQYIDANKITTLHITRFNPTNSTTTL